MVDHLETRSRRWEVDLRGFSMFTVLSEPPIAWSSDSKSLWAATHATSGQPVRIDLDGRLDPLPHLSHAAGPLDAITWAGNDGLAVAQFGTLGRRYHPARNDVVPTLAIVDARRGAVLDELQFSAIEPQPQQISPHHAGPGLPLERADTTVLADGRVRLLFRAHPYLVVWTQGTPPTVLRDPCPRDPYFGPRFSLTPDGAGILFACNLRTDGAEHIRGGGTIPGKPVEGVLVALHDINTGRELWTIRATAVWDYTFPAPVICPDGGTALIGLMPKDGPPPIGLISMKDGRILQTIPTLGVPCTLGFARRGKVVWLYSNGSTALYDVQAE
jgi:hypothetical protein